MFGSAIAVTGSPDGGMQPATAGSTATRTAKSLERYFVIHLIALEAGRGFAGAHSFAATAATFTAAAAVQHHQGPVEILQHHFGGIFLGAVLVGPLAGLKLAFQIDLGALA